MTLETTLSQDLVTALKTKDEAAARAIRAVKTAITVAKTDGSGQVVDDARIVQILQKLVKTRQESLDIYEKNNREDLAVKEREEIVVLKKYLPEMLEGEALEAIVRQIIAETGATSARDMGKVMGAANKQLAGKAEGRAISEVVKRLLQ